MEKKAEKEEAGEVTEEAKAEGQAKLEEMETAERQVKGRGEDTNK
eukprot:gene14741-9673_t